jgi:rare lipoprotein A
MFCESHRPRRLPALLTGAIIVAIAGCHSEQRALADAASQQLPPADPARPPLDRSGTSRVGVASFYADSFAGKPMANGAPMDPATDIAASRTLPLGTTAKVTDISTGKSAIVTIADRGPYSNGRLLDLSPTVARKIGMTSKKGIAKVRITPISVPMPDGSTKPGVAAHDPEVVASR